MISQKVVLVTGANRGLGFAIVSIAATRDPSAHYILTCRDLEDGQKAINELRKNGVTASIESVQLEVTKDADIAKVVESITISHGKLDGENAQSADTCLEPDLISFSVLINNAGIARMPMDTSLPTIRAAYTEMFDVNVTSVACICAAFQPLLAKSVKPKVINITSGLGSIANSLSKKMHRSPPYGTSKVALNGLTAHLQTAENDRVALEKDQGVFTGGPMINYYCVAPGFLKTAFTHFNERGKDPFAGAEVVVRLVIDDTYPGGTQWEFEGGSMQQVPW
ncbi:MAG: hypothetical protein HETSPECPRED_008293 [Heterodermia speciosa]|uniref:Uncharacterized protein n=1 Tax=Heterodermia speciosa TaxID=116794 RepID=A0A8H3FWQ4_9LECA|nr:MAG: hypothetical protein HETSPECPRED_008293 [Heterodermia speciosa]